MPLRPGTATGSRGARRAPCARRSTRALGDRDHHDPRDADAPTISAIELMTTSEERRLAELVPHLEERVLGAEIEVVRLVEAEPWRARISASTSAIASIAAGVVARHDVIIAERNIAGVMLPSSRGRASAPCRRTSCAEKWDDREVVDADVEAAGLDASSRTPIYRTR